MHKPISLIIFSALFLSACASTTEDIAIHTNEHESYNYKNKTYQLLKVKTQLNDPGNKIKRLNFKFENIIKNSIDEELKKLGMKHSSSQADIIVSYGIDVNMTTRTLNLFGNKEEGFFTKRPKGTLTIIISNQKTNNTLWVAWANAQYKQLKTELAIKRLEYAISKLFEEFPK